MQKVFFHIFVTLLFSLCLFNETLASNLLGDWEAELVVPGQKIPLVIHLNETEEGLFGTLDSPRQNAFGLKMSQVSINNDELKFEIEQLKIKYVGSYSSDKDTIEGDFIQHASVALKFSRQTEHKNHHIEPKGASFLSGTWSGNIELPGVLMPFTLHIKHHEDGLEATSDSPKQNAYGLIVDSIHLDKNTIFFEMKSINVTYVGTIDADKGEIKGMFSQNGAPFRLNLLKGTQHKLDVVARPQTPKPPFSYHAEDVSFANAVSGFTLAGTLTKPIKGKAKAAAIMITGSGPQDRDETIFQHKPFLVIADHLTNQGFAILRLDDRGTGQSTGDFMAATSLDFATDIEAAIDYLNQREDFEGVPIGLIGHSEGGIIAPIVASNREDVSFLVLLAAPGLPATELLSERERLYAENIGIKGKELDDIYRTSFNIYRNLTQLPATEKLGNTFKGEIKLNLSKYVSDNQLDAVFKQTIELYDSIWFRTLLGIDPSDALSKISVPVLALNGIKDVQVPAKSNLSAIQAALKAANSKDFKVEALPELNHLFQTSQTGAVEEYAEIEESFAIEALNLISSWLNTRYR